MALIGEMHYLTIGGNTYSIPTSGGSTVSVTRTLTSGTKTATISVDGTSYDLYAPTPNAGTITKVTAGTGLSIGTTAGGNFTTSGTINHTNSVTAQTTQAVYPIKIDAQGHISAYGTAVTSMPASDVSAWAKASTKPSYTFSEIGSKPTTLSGYGITDAYTKTQVDGLVSGVLHYKGTKTTVSALPTSGNTTGDVWHITADGSEWAWDGSAWQELGTAIDLSGYAQLSGASFTGPVTFGDSVTADELETGDLVVTGAASFTNNIAANTINGVTVGDSPKFTDTVTTVTTTGSGNAITAISATDGVITATKGATYVTSSGVTSITLTQGTGISIENSGTAITTTGSRTISLATITKSDTTSTASPAHGGTFTAVDSITYDTYGRVTGVNTKTITLPADSNTHNTAYLYAGASNGTANAATTNGNTYLILMDGGSATTRRKISGSTNVSVASDSSGNITITGPNLSGYALSSAIPTTTSQLTNDGNGTSAFATLADIGSFGGGTVTSITLKAGSGISLDTDNTAITTTGTRTISHADTSSQASSSNSGRTYIQSLTLDTYGHVTGISTATETVTNTDIKLQVAAVTSGTTYYPIVGTGTTAATRQYDTTGFIYKGTNGTTSAVGSAQLTLGNSTASGTANNKQGQLILYGSTAYAHTIQGAPTEARTLTLPNATGTIALTSNIPSSMSGTTANSTTGIIIDDHSTTTIYGVSSSTTTASKVTVGSHSTDYGVTAKGSGSFTQGSFSGGSGSFSATVSNHVLSFSHTHTAATHGADSHTHTAPTLGSKVPTVSASDVTVPIKNSSTTTVVTTGYHGVNDAGHTHTVTVS